MSGVVIALLPMKGHSERVPNKNVRLMAGRPLYHWITRELLRAEMIDEVVVDTDSEAIANDVGVHFPSVHVHERPDHLRGDFVEMHDIVAHVAAQFHGDVILQTHATNPLLRSETIDRAVSAYSLEGDHDSLMSVTSCQARFYFQDGSPVNHDLRKLERTQDLSPLLEENSCIYVASRELILRTGKRVGERPLLFAMGRREAIDIDDEIDFLMAECLIRMDDRA